MSASSPHPSDRHPHYSRVTLWLLATIAGVSVANIYFNQPLLGDFRATFAGSAYLIGAVPAATQLGYALGMLLLAPLGDRFDRRRLILLQLAALGVALIFASTAPTLAILIAASLAIGVVATIAQQAVPFSAELAPAAERGHAVGTVMSGLLLGILLARTVSGFVAQYFALARGVRRIGGGDDRARRRRDRAAAETTLSYGKLLASMWHLTMDNPGLREAALTGGALFAAFSAFWSLLTLLLAGEPFHMGPQAAGLFGIVGAAGALAAPLAGKSADRAGGDFLRRVRVVGAQHRRAGGRRDRARYRRAGRADFESVAHLRAAARGAQTRQHGVYGGVFHRRRGGIGAGVDRLARDGMDRCVHRRTGGVGIGGI
ncbi:MFS transporter [Candidatus Burkholderia verschuerenii]|uniref:MFS transporter n=1 Tax=Candidatus Burkholderia verschuerenii TaxID=242163 RepID=UPI000ABA0D58